MAGIKLKSRADLEQFKQDRSGYFLLFDPKEKVFKVGTYEVNVTKQDPDGTCIVRPVKTELPAGDKRYKTFAQTNHGLTVEILAHKLQVKNPSMTRAEAIAKAEELYAEVAN